MIESINIWKRSHDGKFSICITKKVELTNEEREMELRQPSGGELMLRTKLTFDSFTALLKYLIKEYL